MKNKNGFTLIELLIIVAIIALLVVAITVSMSQARKNARINGAKTSLKTVLPAIVACKDSGGNVTLPSPNADICSAPVGLSGAKWPELAYGYTFQSGGRPGGLYNSVDCNFRILTGSDFVTRTDAFFTCNCAKQACE